MIGSVISHYKILGKLGEGGMGVVYKAEDLRLKRTVALKFLPQDLKGTEAETARFQQEAQAAATLNHPNICTVHAIEEFEGQQFIDMEFIEGVTLRQRLPMKNPNEAASYAIQIGEALHEAHSKGIVHRDIKAENIMVSAKGQIKVMDFGLAKLRGSLKLTRTSSTVGTLAYMAPEQISGGATDTRSDIFSFGVLLYELLAGRTPFRGEHEAAMVYSIVNEEPEPIQKFCPDLAPEFLHILSRALEKDPEDRYQSVNEMVIDLRRLKKQSTKLSRTYSVQHDVSRQIPPDSVPSSQNQVAAGKAGSSPSRKFLWIGIAGLVLVGGIIIYKFVGSGPFETRPSGPLQATFAQITDQAGAEFGPDISPDGNFIVYSKDVAGSSDIFLHRIGGGNPINLTKDSKPKDDEPAFSPDGQWIAFHSDRDGGGIFVMGSTGESVRRLTDFGFNPAWTNDGKEIVCATEDIRDPLRRITTSKLWIIDAKSGEKKILFDGDAVQPSCSPHGIRVAYWGLPLGTGQRDLWTIPLEGGAPTAVTNDAAVDWDPVWSPDGSYLYFSSDRGGSMNLWRIPLDEQSGRVLGSPQPITAPSPWAGPLKVSHDGHRIVYVSLDAKANINKIAFDPVRGKCVGHSVPVTQGSRTITTCNPSPDNQYLVYGSGQGKQEDLYIIKSDGGNVRQLTDDIYKDRGPQWSPDGKRILFYSNRSGRYELWAINSDGSRLEQLTRTTGKTVSQPRWFPDGKRIALYMETCSILDLTEPIEQRIPRPIAPLEDKDQTFYATSVSPDGRYLAGYRARSNGVVVPGVVLYSIEEKHFQTVADSGSHPLWLNDGRRLFFTKDNGVFLLDTQTKKSYQVSTGEMDNDRGGYTMSSDNRTLYFVRSSTEADIWQAELR